MGETDFFSEFAERITRERTALLAGRADRDAEGTAEERLMAVLTLGGQQYLMEARHIARISAPSWRAMPVDGAEGRSGVVLGLYGYLSVAYAVVDLAPLLGLGRLAGQAGAMLLLRPMTDSRGNSVNVALLVGRVVDLMRVCAQGVAGEVPVQGPVQGQNGGVLSLFDPVRLLQPLLDLSGPVRPALGSLPADFNESNIL
jgi:chemotaxis signal transduction protein